MADRPIIFSAAMVRALLDGRKTQTRRLTTSPLHKCEIGDRLWVREEWRVGGRYDPMPPRDLPPCSMTVMFGAGGSIANLDGGFWAPDEWPEHGNMPRFAGKRRPGMHMPRWASRLTLIVEAVRVEPLQAISEADAIAEGVEQAALNDHWRDYGADPLPLPSPVESYRSLWISLHGPVSWAANPEVIALTFRVERGNIDRIAA